MKYLSILKRARENCHYSLIRTNLVFGGYCTSNSYTNNTSNRCILYCHVTMLLVLLFVNVFWTNSLTQTFYRRFYFPTRLTLQEQLSLTFITNTFGQTRILMPSKRIVQNIIFQ